MKHYSRFLKFSLSKASWLILFLVSFFCLSVSFLFQYALNLPPCVMCIQERMFVMGLCSTGLVGIFFRQCLYMRGIVLGGWLVNSVGGLNVAIQHLMLQLKPSILAACGPQVDFPSIIPLNEWFPSIFMAYGAREESVWSFAGVSMTQLVVTLFVINTALALIFVIVELIASVRHDGVWLNGIPSEESDKQKLKDNY